MRGRLQIGGDHTSAVPYILLPHAFGDTDPRKYGFDASAGFPPHEDGWIARERSRIWRWANPSFQGRALLYDDMVRRAVSTDPDDYLFFPGVCPSWDNEARRLGRGVVFHGSTPDKFGRWLEAACRAVVKRHEVDQPDRHYGYAFLAEVTRALTRVARSHPSLSLDASGTVSSGSTAT